MSFMQQEYLFSVCGFSLIRLSFTFLEKYIFFVTKSLQAVSNRVKIVSARVLSCYEILDIVTVGLIVIVAGKQAVLMDMV